MPGTSGAALPSASDGGLSASGRLCGVTTQRKKVGFDSLSSSGDDERLLRKGARSLVYETSITPGAGGRALRKLRRVARIAPSCVE